MLIFLFLKTLKLTLVHTNTHKLLTYTTHTRHTLINTHTNTYTPTHTNAHTTNTLSSVNTYDTHTHKHTRIWKNTRPHTHAHTLECVCESMIDREHACLRVCM